MSSFTPPHLPRMFWPDAPPTTAGASDDEFNDNSVAGAWTEFDPGSDVTVSEDSHGLLLVNTNTGSVSWGGVYKALPGGDFSITTKMSLVASAASEQMSAGILIGQDLSSGTDDDLETLELQLNGSGVNARVITWSAYNAFNSVVKSLPWYQIEAYLRVRRASTTYSFDISPNGVAWAQLKTGSLDISTPVHIGLAISTESVVTDGRARFRFYRETSTTTRDTAVLGRFI